MNNIQKIFFFQKIPTILKNFYTKFAVRSKVSNSIIENIDYFKSDKPKKRNALVALSPNAWITAVKQYPNIKYFNFTGLMYEMVKGLNEEGYTVDIVDSNTENKNNKNYSLFIGHGGKCKTIIDNLPSETKIIQYISGAFWKIFYKESEERYNSFIKRRNIKEKLNLKRNMDLTIGGEEYLTKKAHVLINPNCPKVVDSFGEYKNKFFYPATGFASYVEKSLLIPIEEKAFDIGNKSFIYVGGTGGNIQKGMDVLIEAFAKNLDLHLYIYCKVEDEILKSYANELRLPNIHYIFHWQRKPLQKKLKQLIRRTNFTIHAPINTGIGTAFLGSMGLGLIPVGYIDLIAPKESCVLSDSWDSESLSETIREASQKSTKWCKNAYILTLKNINENWSVENFRKRFRELIKNMDDL
ncbi:MAG: hypothetical protein D8M58_04360 [Calditrichaeota bacterium]|nr:MAG: hypothetical protein DWQ03_02715 [Calditrichota bacterium]MBL1204603.1 hypothetical protein [Calditrichota bacterium]NOG44432.1 hypothetical protein [Calditrichota bacterium]